MNGWVLTYRCELPEGTEQVLVPGGLGTPEGRSRVIAVEGAAREIREATTGQTALAVTPRGGTFSVTYGVDPGGAYPEAIFHPQPSRFTRAADALVAEVALIAPETSGLARATAIACATAERFTYGHPEARFNDGFDTVPALGCGVTEGSCVDINTYFLAALRSAGIEAGYVTGFFFPEEKRGTCTDGHCWVVTRIGDDVQAWDIAHHLKMGTRVIAPALNPKPGHRVACFHSMGLGFPELGVTGIKALIEPVPVTADGPCRFETPEIRWSAG